MFKAASVVVLLLLASAATAQDIQGPVYPPPGGVTFSSSGTSAGDAGGVVWSYSAFNPSAFAALIWGPDTSVAAASRVGAGLDGVLHALSFSGITGSSAEWSGTTGWSGGGGGPHAIKLLITVVSGGLGWMPEGSLPPDPDIAGVGAVIDNSTGVDFSIRLEFLADVGSGFQAINSIVPQTTGRTVSSYAGAFYYLAAVSEPGSIALVGLGLLMILLRRRHSAVKG